MKKLITVFWLLFGIFSNQFVGAQTQGEWTILIEPVYMSMYNDFRAGDIYTFYSTDLNIPRKESKPGEYTSTYGTLYNPIILTMPHKLIFVWWEINNKVKTEKWGFGMRGWKFKNLARKHDSVSQFDTKHNEDGSITRFIRGIGMADYMIEPFNKRGDLPIDWWAKNSLKTWMREIYASRTFSNTLSARFGIKVAEITNSHDIGQRHWTSENESIKYEITSEVNYMVIGPNLGFDIYTKYFSVFLQQSVLFGTATHIGRLGVNSHTIENSAKIIAASQKSYGVYSIPLNIRTSEIIPSTELNIKLLIKEKKLAHDRSIKLRCSLFTSAFWQTPLAPSWKVGKRDWFKKRQDLILAGGAISAEIKF